MPCLSFSPHRTVSCCGSQTSGLYLRALVLAVPVSHTTRCHLLLFPGLCVCKCRWLQLSLVSQKLLASGSLFLSKLLGWGPGPNPVTQNLDMLPGCL